MRDPWLESERPGERRSGGDRRGSGLSTPSTGPRPYGFRRFDDRRRWAATPEAPADAARRADAGGLADDAPALMISLTHADLRALLRWLGSRD